MASKVVGLDIGTSAVRAAEVEFSRGRHTLVRFGQLSLPEGAVEDGEIRDPFAVAEVVRQLWENAAFTTKDVVVGLNSQRLVVRTMEVAAFDDPEEMDSALRLDAMETIPIPVEEAILDFQEISRRETEEGENRADVLLAAAQEDLVNSYREVASAAGLSVVGVDLLAFALVRATTGGSVSDDQQTEAIVSVGAAVTSVAVHKGSTPLFIRVLRSGSNNITDALVQAHDIEFEMAEAVKRTVSTGGTQDVAPAAVDTLNRAVAPIVEEIRGSLDFYSAQPDAAPIKRLVITGAGSSVLGLTDRLKRELDIDVDFAHPLMFIDVDKNVGFDTQSLVALEPMLTASVGLALWASPLQKGEKRISLLPDSARSHRDRRKQRALIATSLVFISCLLMLVWSFGQYRVALQDRKLHKIQADVAGLQGEAAQLNDVAEMLSVKQKGQTLSSTILTGDVSHRRLLKELAYVMPPGTHLTTINFQKGKPSTMTFTAEASSQKQVADFLEGLKKLNWLDSPWISNSTKQSETETIQFQGTANLNSFAHSSRKDDLSK